MKARLMKYIASTRPTVRKKMVNSRPWASGWRAAPWVVAPPARAAPAPPPAPPPAQRTPAADEGAGQLDRSGGAAPLLGKEQCGETHVFPSCSEAQFDLTQ